MVGPRDDHTKRSKSERERQISYDIIYMLNLKQKMIQMNLFTKQTHRHSNKLMDIRGEGWEGGINQEFGIDIYTLLYIK